MSEKVEDTLINQLLAQQTKLLSKYEKVTSLMEEKNDAYVASVKKITADSIAKLKVTVSELNLEKVLEEASDNNKALRKEVENKLSKLDYKTLVSELDKKVEKSIATLEGKVKEIDLDKVVKDLKTETDSVIKKVKDDLSVKVDMVEFQHTLPSILKPETKYTFTIIGNRRAIYSMDDQKLLKVSDVKGIRAGDKLTITTPKLVDDSCSYELEITENLYNETSTKIIDVEVSKGNTNNSGTGVIEEGIPILFGIISGYKNYAQNRNHSTSDFTTQSSDYVRRMIMGWGDWKLPQHKVYANGISNNFVYKDEYSIYASSSHKYNYADKAVSAMFIKNDTNDSRSFQFYFGGSSNGRNGGHGYSHVWTGTPNSSRGRVSNISMSNRYTYTGGTGAWNTSTRITVPANTTIVLFFSTSAYYYTSDNNNYRFGLGHNVYNLHNIKNAGLKMDYDLTERMLASYKNSVSKIHEIWNEGV